MRARSAFCVLSVACSRSRVDFNSSGSIRARTSPFLTVSLKQTPMSLIGAGTDAPTLNVWTGLTGPDELTTVSLLPVETVAVVNLETALALRYCWPKKPATTIPPSGMARIKNHFTRRRIVDPVKFNHGLHG